MKIVRAIFVTLCLTSISCSKKESDFLETLQIIGEWKLESMTFGGITSMNVEFLNGIQSSVLLLSK
ncbi:MAG: hypothetical protein EBZ25_07110 [Flavobacteriia bacterium]|nr:hypothetical protein [Flavobacteriia bacterium]